jgi:hypothetical protein
MSSEESPLRRFLDSHCLNFYWATNGSPNWRSEQIAPSAASG